MGTSTDAILAYGYEIHNPDEGWLVYEPDEHIDALPWCKPICYCDTEDEPECDCELEIEESLSAALKETKLSTEYHCHHDHSVLMITAWNTTAWRGDPKYLDLAALEATRIAEDWDGLLTAGMTKLGITPKQDKPRWILASYWG